MDLSVGLCVQVAAAMAVHGRHSCWSRPEQAGAAVEQSACLFVAAASPSRRSSWRTRASTRTVVGMSIERWCPLNMVRLDRRSAHRVSTRLQRAVSSPRARSSQPALPGAFQRRTPNRRGAFDRQRSISHGSTNVQYSHRATTRCAAKTLIIIMITMPLLASRGNLLR